MIEPIDLTQATDFTRYTMIRGYPRRRDYVEEVQKMYGAALVGDEEASLLKQLDHHLFVARQKMGEYPELLVMPSEPLSLFLPIPYDIAIWGVTLEMFDKPAWFRVKRGIRMPLAPWKKK